ncbi:MAG: TFIIB-type zinc ribbon-containing protein [Candidatus Thermoplasmatota archaeon]|nr:TFIIB-type zinc ribbon-containing protein [Candidatus Thermoplasmatota archaeon]
MDDARRFNGYPILCPYCRVRTFERRDSKQGNYFCENCGFVTKEIRVMYRAGKVYEYTVDVGKIPYKPRNIRRLQRKYENKVMSKGERRKHRVITEYKSYLDYIAGEFNMTAWQRNEILRDMKRVKSLKLFCGNCDHKKIIMAMCIYLMRADNKRIYDFERYNIIKDSGLTEKAYINIVEKYSTFKIRNK